MSENSKCHWRCDFVDFIRTITRRGSSITSASNNCSLHAALTQVDEVLTPDSSRYWPIEGYEAAFTAGKNPPSFDKQYLGDWLERVRVDGQPWKKKRPRRRCPPR